MRTRLSLLAVLVACAAPRPQPPRGAEVLRVEGEVENAPFRFGRDDLPLLPRRSFDAVPPSGGSTRVRFEGVALDALLSDRMEVKREADTAVMHTADGAAVPVSLPMIRQLRPVLADHVDGQPAGAAPAADGSLSLAWPTIEHPGIDTDPRLRWWWVRSVRSISVQSWVETYGKALRVPAGAKDDARHGADVLGSQCIGCHRVRGVGGTRGPALEAGTGPATRLTHHAPALRDHLRAVSGTRAAPELTRTMAVEVTAFLDAVRLAGPEQEEPKAPASPPAGDTPFPPIPGEGHPPGR